MSKRVWFWRPFRRLMLRWHGHFPFGFDTKRGEWVLNNLYPDDCVVTFGSRDDSGERLDECGPWHRGYAAGRAASKPDGKRDPVATARERFTYDDEIVTGQRLHMERMDDDHIWFCVGERHFDLHAEVTGLRKPVLRWYGFTDAEKAAEAQADDGAGA